MRLLSLSNLRITAVAIILLLPYFLSSQTKLFSEVYDIPLTFVKESKAYKDLIVSSSNDSNLFFSFRNPDRSKKRLLIHSINTKTNKKSQLELKKSDKTKDIFSQRIFSFLVINQKFILVNDDYIYSFNILKDQLVLNKVQKNKKSYRNIYLLNRNECLLYQNYNFHPLDQFEKHVWAKYYLSNDSLSDFLNMPENNVKFSSLFNSWLSVYKGLIAYASTTNYLIEFHDSNFNKLDSIKTNELDSNKFNLDQLQDSYSKDAVYNTIKLDDSLFTRITKINLIDSTHLLVVLKFPNKFKPKNYRLDLWESINGTWTKIKQEYHESFYTKGVKYNKDNQPLIGFFGNSLGIEIINKDFYIVSYPFEGKCTTESFDRNKDYESKLNEIIKSKQFYYEIRKLKLNL